MLFNIFDRIMNWFLAFFQKLSFAYGEYLHKKKFYEEAAISKSNHNNISEMCLDYPKPIQ